MVSEDQVREAALNYIFNTDRDNSDSTDTALAAVKAFEAGAKCALAHVQSVPYPDNTHAFDDFGVSDKK